MDFSRKDYIDSDRIQRLFADASTVVHFLFVKKTKADSPTDFLPGMGDITRGGASALSKDKEIFTAPSVSLL